MPWNQRAVYGAAVVLIYLSPTPYRVGVGTSRIWAVFQTIPLYTNSLVPRLVEKILFTGDMQVWVKAVVEYCSRK